VREQRVVFGELSSFGPVLFGHRVGGGFLQSSLLTAIKDTLCG
jgi:hypothetical protein